MMAFLTFTPSKFVLAIAMLTRIAQTGWYVSNVGAQRSSRAVTLIILVNIQPTFA
jgi:hypothetical protein